MKTHHLLISALSAIALTATCSHPAHPTPDPGPEPEPHTGAFFSDDYTSPFKTVLGKTDAEIQQKMDQLWSHYFKGRNDEKIFYDSGGEAYILDVKNNEVRSEGMAYGMMIAVQTDHKSEFDLLWRWAKNHMWNKSGQWDGYFAWQCTTSGSRKDNICCPEAEMYMMASLLFAANRWVDDTYMEDAQYILKKMWENPAHKLFNTTENVITLVPNGAESNFTNPSYDLPAFTDLFARWSETNQDKWKAATSATRNHLYKSSHTGSGLFCEYNNFDGTPHPISYNPDASKYAHDAVRCAMNFGMDYYLFGLDDVRQSEMARRIIDFFETDKYSHGRFNWDGSNPFDAYTLGEKGANAVACYALIGNKDYETAVRTNLQMAWDASPLTGENRYYDGLVHYLAMLHLTGNFKIWKPKS